MKRLVLAGMAGLLVTAAVLAQAQKPRPRRQAGRQARRDEVARQSGSRPRAPRRPWPSSRPRTGKDRHQVLPRQGPEPREEFPGPGEERVLQRDQVPPRRPGLHDPGRRPQHQERQQVHLGPGRQRGQGRQRGHRQGRVQRHPPRPRHRLHGPRAGPQFGLLAVLHLRGRRRIPGRQVHGLRRGRRGHGRGGQDRRRPQGPPGTRQPRGQPPRQPRGHRQGLARERPLAAGHAGPGLRRHQAGAARGQTCGACGASPRRPRSDPSASSGA